MSAGEKEGHGSTRPHWFSYTQTTLGSNKICAISVVLDAGAQESFSGIRVIVVRQENDSFSDVKLQHCFDTSTWNVFQRPSQSIFATYHESKANYRKTRALSQRLLEDSSRLDILGHNLPLCTIIFELQDTGTSQDPSVYLSIRSYTRSDSPLRILYDHAVPDKTFLTFLESAQPFRKAITSPVENSMFFAQYNESDIHVVRVLSVSGTRRSFPALPFKILRRIAEEVIGHQYPGWRASLLSCALVCKAWYPLVDMFFDTLGSTLNDDKLYPQAVANSLERQPKQGHLIRRIDYRNFKSMPDDPERNGFSKALISVLRMSTLVKEVILCEMPSSLNVNLFDALGQLEKVEIYTMYLGGFHFPVTGKAQFPDIVDTQRSIANWTELRVLKLSQWEKPKLESSCQKPSKSKLEHLWLKDGSLTGAQLLWFASPYSRIRELSLIKIQGLSNLGLLRFLQEISSTLVKLAITGSTITRETADEAYAVDVVMSKMVLLNTAHVSGDILTARAISTKPKNSGYSPTRNFITITRAPQMDNIDEVITSFDTTGWDGVDVASSNVVAWNNDAQERVFQSARECGVQFACFIDVMA